MGFTIPFQEPNLGFSGSGMVEKYYHFINFSSSTTPYLSCKTLDDYCDLQEAFLGIVLWVKRANKWLVVFSDNVNLPDVDKYSTQNVLTFPRETTKQNSFLRPQDK